MPKPNPLTTDHILNLTKTMVAISSVTMDEQPFSDWVANYLTDIGLHGVTQIPVAESGDSVIGYIDGTIDQPSLLLVFHLDTFPAFDNWYTDPLTPTLVEHTEGPRLYGLGTHDMKGGAACLLAAVEGLVQAQSRLGGRVYVVATSDEENWSRGAHAVIDYTVAQGGLLDNCRYCIIPEPLDAGQLIVGARGRHVFQATFEGKTVHAAFGGGVNAAVDAAKAAVAISQPDGIDLGYNRDFDTGGTLSVTGIQGGGRLILVPERTDLFIDRMTIPGQTATDAADQIRMLIEGAGIDGTYTLAYDQRPTPAPTAYVVPPESHFVKVLRRQVAQSQELPSPDAVILRLARSVADTNHFAQTKEGYSGIPTLICGPQGGNTCEANEYLRVDSLLPTAEVLYRSALELLDASK